MDAAAARLADAIRNGEPLAIFGDYDVDGATSSALLARFLSAVGVPARVYIPDRITEGYGPTTPAMMRLRAEGIKLVITVDCGTTAFEPLDAAGRPGSMSWWWITMLPNLPCRAPCPWSIRTGSTTPVGRAPWLPSVCRFFCDRDQPRPA